MFFLKAVYYFIHVFQTSYYSGLGGENLNSTVYRILRESLSDSFAVNFNFFGRNNKKAFNELKLCKCIIGLLFDFHIPSALHILRQLNYEANSK